MGLLKNILKNAIGIDDKFTKMIYARDNGEVWAQEMLASMFHRNEPDLIERIKAARRKLYAQDAENGNPKAMYYYGISALDFNTFMRMLEPLANKGDIDAITAISNEYYMGNIVAINEEEGFKWCLKAAQLGDVWSQNQVALAYTSNNGSGANDYDKAFEWYSAAARQGSCSGYCGMGKCYDYWQMKLYRNGYDPSMDQKILEYDQKMIDCYEKASNFIKNNDEEVEALYGLARSYQSAGDHVPDQDTALQMKKLAVFYYYAAYDSGYPYGMKYAKEIAENENIYVDFNDVIGWAQKEGIVDK